MATRTRVKVVPKRKRERARSQKRNLAATLTLPRRKLQVPVGGWQQLRHRVRVFCCCRCLFHLFVCCFWIGTIGEFTGCSPLTIRITLLDGATARIDSDDSDVSHGSESESETSLIGVKEAAVMDVVTYRYAQKFTVLVSCGVSLLTRLSSPR